MSLGSQKDLAPDGHLDSPLVATCESPTLEVEYSGMKKEIIFEIRALNSPHVA